MHKRATLERFTIFQPEDDTVDCGSSAEDLYNQVEEYIDDEYKETYRNFYDDLEDLSSGVYEMTLTLGDSEAYYFIVISN